MKEINVLTRKNTKVLTLCNSLTSDPSSVRLQPSLKTKLSIRNKFPLLKHSGSVIFLYQLKPTEEGHQLWSCSAHIARLDYTRAPYSQERVSLPPYPGKGVNVKPYFHMEFGSGVR